MRQLIDDMKALAPLYAIIGAVLACAFAAKALGGLQ